MATVRIGNVVRHTLDRKPPKPIHCAPTLVVVGDNPWNLSKMQRRVFAALCNLRATRRSAALQLGISPKTLETHLTRAREQMGVTTGNKAIYLWLRLNMPSHLEDTRAAAEEHLIEKLRGLGHAR